MIIPTKSKDLKEYLDFYGILSCNVNPYLPSLSDIGAGWQDVVSLIDSHELFYCKAYRKRTTYISNQVYFLLKQCRVQKPLNCESEQIYELIKSVKCLDIEEIKLNVCMDPRKFSKAFLFLLENLYITAFKNGKVLNPTWSTFIYSTAETWEYSVTPFTAVSNPENELKTVLLRTMSEAEVNKLISN